MFSDEITSTDSFLDMPSGSQLLYFHLGMEADDDGFISSPKMVMRAMGAADDELKILFAKKFLLPFDNGVCVVKHWRINNYIRKDIYKETKYTDLKDQLYIKKNGGYSFNPNGAIRMPQGHFPLLETVQNKDKTTCTSRARDVHSGKDRIGKDSNTYSARKRTRVVKKTSEYDPLGAEVLKAFEEVDPKNKTSYGNKTQRAACDFLLSEHGLDKVLRVVALLNKTNTLSYFPTITSPYDLKEKWSKLESALIKKKGENINKGRGVAE